MFEATCNLLMERTCPSTMDVPEDDALAVSTAVYDFRKGRAAYWTACTFGTTTDRDEFERHMKAAHPERCTPTFRRRKEAKAGGWKMRPAFKAQTDRPWTKLMKDSLTECPDCGTWVETGAAHDCLEITS